MRDARTVANYVDRKIAHLIEAAGAAAGSLDYSLRRGRAVKIAQRGQRRRGALSK
jgi:hypothetical protein